MGKLKSCDMSMNSLYKKMPVILEHIIAWKNKKKYSSVYEAYL